MSPNRPLIIGHRGAAGEAPENTLASFALALEQGAEGIELDVHLSKDGRIVVCHDPTLDRTTTGHGLIHEMNYEDIRQYDAGSRFSEWFAGEKVPLLDDVFDLVPPHIFINIEVKHTYNGLMETALIDFLRKRGRLDNVVISSFDHTCVIRIKRAEQAARIGLLFGTKLADYAAYARSLNVEVLSLHPYHLMLNPEDVKGARARGLLTFPYTANAMSDLQRLIDAGVSGIITDFPGRLASML
jgi:glycerophosphoryl diester phosphodiesterase